MAPRRFWLPSLFCIPHLDNPKGITSYQPSGCLPSEVLLTKEGEATLGNRPRPKSFFPAAPLFQSPLCAAATNHRKTLSPTRGALSLAPASWSAAALSRFSRCHDLSPTLQFTTNLRSTCQRLTNVTPDSSGTWTLDLTATAAPGFYRWFY